MTNTNTPLIALKAIVGEDGRFTFMIAPGFTFSSPEKLRWEMTFGQGSLHRGIITFQAGEADTRPIPQSILQPIDPAETYWLRVYRITDHNHGADDALLFQQQSKTIASSSNDAHPHDIPQRAGMHGDQGDESMLVANRASFAYNSGETIAVLEQKNLLTISQNEPDPTTLIYTITKLPTHGTLWKGDTQIDEDNNQFTQADINAGRITYRPSDDDAAAQGDRFSFTVSDGTLSLPDQTLQFTPRVVYVYEEGEDSDQDNTINLAFETAPQKIDAGDGSDTITGGPGDDQIDGGAGDDDITLSPNAQEDSGADEVLYTFGYDGVGIDGGDAITGFRRGQDKLTFVVKADRDITTLTAFLNSIKGADGEGLTSDDAFIMTMLWGAENGAFYFNGVLLHFKEASAFGGGRISSPLVQIIFDERLNLDDLLEILGGAEKVTDNFDFTYAAFKNLADVLPRLFGEGSIDFVVIPLDDVEVIGPVLGAKIFFDLDDDGEITDAEKNAQHDEFGRALYITGEDGRVFIPEQYVDYAFIADVDGAYDTATGTRLKGTFHSLDGGRGGSATPITDLITTYLKEGEGEANAPTTEQGVLNMIFGDDVITVADILDMDNYKVPAPNAPDEAKKQMITTAAIALTEIKKDDTLAGGDDQTAPTKAEIIVVVSTLLTTPDDNGVAGLKKLVDARITEATAVQGGKPIATPADVETIEDTDYAFPNTPGALTELFGFLDPGGNSAGAESALVGVYIKIDIENASLWLDDGTTEVTADNASTLVLGGSNNDGAPEVKDYIYVTLDKLDELKLRPALDFNGTLKLVYRVWDGEETSSDAELTFKVAGVNDAPVASIDVQTQIGQKNEVLSIDLSAFFSDPDGDDVTLIARLTDGGELIDIGLTYNPDNKMLTGTPTKTGLYEIEIAASDGKGGEAVMRFFIDIYAEAVLATVGDDISIFIDPAPFVSSESGLIYFSATLLVGEYGGVSPEVIGLRFNEDTNNLEGTIKTPGTYTIFVYAHDAAGSRIANYLFTLEATEANQFSDDIPDQIGLVNQAITPIDLSTLLSNPDTDTLTVMVVLEDGATAALSTIGLSYNSDTKMITGTPTKTTAYRIEVLVSDGDSGAITASTFIIDVNAPPQGTNIGEQLTMVNQAITPIDLGSFFTDFNGDTLTLTVTFRDKFLVHRSLSEIGLTYNPVNKMLTGTPTEGNTYQIEVVASDGKGGWAVERFNIMVVSAAVVEDDATQNSATGTITVPDPALRGNGIGTYGTMTFDAITQVWTYTLDNTRMATQALAEGQLETERFIFSTTDVGDFNVAITVIGANDAPVADTDIQTQIGRVDQAISIDLGTLFRDPDGDDVSLIVRLADGRELSAIGLTYNPNNKMITGPPTERGLYQIEIMASDGKGGTAVMEFYIDVYDEGFIATRGDSISISIDPATFDAPERGPLSFNVTLLIVGNYGVALEAIGLTYSEVRDEITNEITSIEITGTPNVSGTYTIYVDAYNGDSPRAVGHLFTIEVTDANQSLDDALSQIGTVGQPITAIDLSTLLSNPDSETLTVMVVLEDGSKAALGVIGLFYDSETKMITGTPKTTGTYTIEVVATDSTSGVATTSIFTIEINTPPMLDRLIGDQLTTVNQAIDAVDLSTLFTDPDGDDLTLTVTFRDSYYIHRNLSDIGLTYNPANNLLTGTPTEAGFYQIEAVASDGKGGWAVVRFFIVVDFASVVEDDASQNSVIGILSQFGLMLEGNGIGTYGTMTFDAAASIWTYTLDNTREATQALAEGQTETEIFTFVSDTGADSFIATITVAGANDAPVKTGVGQFDIFTDLTTFFTDPDGDDLNLMVTLLSDTGEEDLSTIGLTYDPDVGITGTLGDFIRLAGETHMFKVVVTDDKGGSLTLTFTKTFESSIKLSGGGKDGATVGDAAAISSQFLLGGDNQQTLNAGLNGDLIFGGRGDDIINLGADEDIILYRYDGVDKTNSVAHDGGDVINNFDLGEDILILIHAGNNAHANAAEFFEAIKGVSLLADRDGNITGIVFTFTDRTTPTQDIDLTVNFRENDFVPPSAIDLTAFEDVNAAGRRVIKTDQKAAAYQAIYSLDPNGESVQLVNFDDLGIEFNPTDTDII